MSWVPLAGNSPDQAPEAVHELAFVEFQVSVVDWPMAMSVCAALKAALGCDLSIETPAPQEVSEIAATTVRDAIPSFIITHSSHQGLFSWIVCQLARTR